MNIYKKIFFIFLFLSLDQVSKFFVKKMDDPFEIFSFFHINFVQNEGIAFSLPFPKIAVIILTICVLIFLFEVLIRKKLTKIETFCTILIFAGASGNLIDRIIDGKVTDFLAFWDFPIFNLADSFISVGVCLLIADEIFLKKFLSKKN